MNACGPPPGAGGGKDFRERTLRSLKVSLGRLWRRRSVTITEYDPSYKVAYLGNVLTGWAKGEGCVEKPLSTLWKNYMGSSKPDVQMKVTVTQAGLKAVTKEHGLTEYWSHRVTYCAAPSSSFPRIFCWVYRHEGRKLKQELRCHAVLCPKESVARDMAAQLTARLAQALSEFKRDKVSRQNARLSLANSVYDNPSMPRRKILLSTGSHNYRPPLERSKSAPKLMVIEEEGEAEEQELQEERRRNSEDTSSPRRVYREPQPAEKEVSLEEEILAILQQQQQQKPAKRVAWDDRLSECGPDSDEGTSLPADDDDDVDDDVEEEEDEAAGQEEGSAVVAPDVVSVDLRPTAGVFLGRKLERSATFPPPRAAGGGSDSLELDSLSEEEEDEEDADDEVLEEDNVSDESGFAELPEAKDGSSEDPKHQALLGVNSVMAHCVQV